MICPTPGGMNRVVWLQDIVPSRFRAPRLRAMKRNECFWRKNRELIWACANESAMFAVEIDHGNIHVAVPGMLNHP